MNNIYKTYRFLNQQWSQIESNNTKWLPTLNARIGSIHPKRIDLWAVRRPDRHVGVTLVVVMNALKRSAVLLAIIQQGA